MLMLFNMFPFDAMPPKDEEVSRKFIKLILDFAENGKSTLYEDWQPLDVDSPSYLLIDEEFKPVKEELPYQKNMKFWDSLNVYWNYQFPRKSTPKIRSGNRDEL